MKFDLRNTMAVAGALMTAACNNQPDEWTAQRDTAVCTDRSGRRVPDEQCQRYHAHAGGVSPFLWYYLGRSSAIPPLGERIGGGSYRPTGGHSYSRAPASTGVTRSVAISRGGFGASARGFGGVHA